MTALAQQNVVTFLASAAIRVPRRPALVLQTTKGESSAISFAELWEQVDRTSAGLRKAGLQPGERAILMVPMSMELYVALLAVLKCGAIAVFVDPWVGRQQIAAFASFAKASAWIGIPKSHLLRLADSSLRRIPLTVTTGRRWWGWGGRHALKELQQHPGDGQIAAVEANDTAMITFTSGSSGLPKGVNRTHGFLTAQHAALQAEFPQLEDDVDMPVFPVFALNNIARGIPSIIPLMDFRRVDQVDGQTIAEQMLQSGVTTCTASPPFIDRLATYQQNHSGAVHLRRILTGGAPVSDQQLATWLKTWPESEVLVVYGSTEAEPVAHIHADERLRLAKEGKAKGYCLGKPSEQIAARVIKIHSEAIKLDQRGWGAWELPVADAGEIVVSGKHVAQSYFENTAATAENKIVDREGNVWHRMGDTGYFDRDGRLWLVGRVHSTILRAGRAIHPQLVEQAALDPGDAVVRVAAVGMPDEALGQRVVVVVETSAGAELLPTIRKRIEEAGFPVDEIRLAQQPLPLDPRHRSKIDYHALRESLRQ